MFLVERFKKTSIRFLKAPNGELVIVGTDLIESLKGDKANAADLIKKNVRAKWWIDLPNPNGGRPVRCLFEPGAYQLAGNPMFTTEFAEEFQDWLFEDVLPKLRASGGYIMPTATSDQLQALKAEIEQQIAKTLRNPDEVLDHVAYTERILIVALNTLLYQVKKQKGKKTIMFADMMETMHHLYEVAPGFANITKVNTVTRQELVNAMLFLSQEEIALTRNIYPNHFDQVGGLEKVQKFMWTIGLNGLPKGDRYHRMHQIVLDCPKFANPAWFNHNFVPTL